MHTHFVRIRTNDTRCRDDEPIDFDNEEDLIFETPMEFHDPDGTLEDTIHTIYTRLGIA